MRVATVLRKNSESDFQAAEKLLFVVQVWKGWSEMAISPSSLHLRLISVTFLCVSQEKKMVQHCGNTQTKERSLVCSETVKKWIALTCPGFTQCDKGEMTNFE